MAKTGGRTVPRGPEKLLRGSEKLSRGPEKLSLAAFPSSGIFEGAVLCN